MTQKEAVLRAINALNFQIKMTEETLESLPKDQEAISFLMEEGIKKNKEAIEVFEKINKDHDLL